MIKEAIEAYESLKKNTYYIDRGDKEPIIIKFNNEHFYHLLGLHYLNIDIHFPKEMKSKDSKYRYIKKNVDRFEKIIKNRLLGKDGYKLRINTFPNIKFLFEDNSALLYDLKDSKGMFDGDYGMLKLFDQKVYCLLALANIDKINNSYVPQSWMPSARRSRMINKIPEYYKQIMIISNSLDI